MRRRKAWRVIGLLCVLILAAVMSFGCGSYAPVSTKVDVGPPATARPSVVLSPSCAPGKVAPGLNISFRYNKYNHIVEIDPTPKRSDKKGKPIPNLNYQFGSKELLDSGSNEGVACLIDGYILMDRPGAYEFKALSNDGISVSIDGKMILEDPTKHADRMSDVWKVVSPGVGACTSPGQQPGWHRFHAIYFQRKGTAAVELYWKQPGDNDFSIVPPEAFGHV